MGKPDSYLICSDTAGQPCSALPTYLGYRSFIAAELRRRAGRSGTELLDRLCAAVGDGEISDPAIITRPVAPRRCGSMTESPAG